MDISDITEMVEKMKHLPPRPKCIAIGEEYLKRLKLMDSFIVQETPIESPYFFLGLPVEIDPSLGNTFEVRYKRRVVMP